ncbi:AraC family transcriptional regulator [Salibacterium sp. K-3]
MPEIEVKKYVLENEAFFIQYMNLKGYFQMNNSHQHDCYEIFYLLEGERVYFINGREFTAQKGDMVIINPYDRHHTASSEAAGFKRILIYFKPEFIFPCDKGRIPSILPFTQGSQLLKFSAKEQYAIEQHIHKMYKECTEQWTGYEICVQSLMAQLLVHIHRHLTLRKQSSVEHTHPMFGKIKEVIEYLHQHYDEDITLEKTAKQFYISPSYLSRSFKRVTGVPFREYLLEKRIKEAQHLLRVKEEKIITVADTVGFSNISHFQTMFKKVVGMTPLQYRFSSEPC